MEPLFHAGSAGLPRGVDDTATRTLHIVIDPDSGADERAQRLREEMLAR